ncbi:hypothetical protein [Fructilactobacillus sanfranciscensis]|uniref:hypothetical protein n=1 Tax=Fructilactobacillus sanfranciscensis TaxID=1625 RepID=UPI003756C373
MKIKNISLKKPKDCDEIITGTFSIDDFKIKYEISPNMNKKFVYNVRFYSITNNKLDSTNYAVEQTIRYNELNFKDEYDVYDWDDFLDRAPITNQGTPFVISFND